MRSSILRFAQRLFLGIGVLTLSYAGGTVAYASIYQRYQSWQFEQKVTAFKVIKPVDETVAANAGPTGSSRQETVEEMIELREGVLIGKLEVPRIGISVMIHHGMEEHTLTVGAGHVPATPLPGGDGNVVIAAHRDTFFRKLEEILPGDSIRVATVGRIYQYVVDSTEIVDPEDTQVMESRAYPQLTLITCYPFYFVGAAPKRFIVHARPLQ